MKNLALNLGSLRQLYRSGEAAPSDVIAEVYDRIRSGPLAPVWISLVPRETRWRGRANWSATRWPRPGRSTACRSPSKTTSTWRACRLPPAVPTTPIRPHAAPPWCEALVDAGAIPIGKTNMDQFATGLVGTRSPHGACSCVFDERYISGGSSSGSAVAVASGLVSFALGTDTAGSGRVPAAFNRSGRA